MRQRSQLSAVVERKEKKGFGREVGIWEYFEEIRGKGGYDERLRCTMYGVRSLELICSADYNFKTFRHTVN